METEVSIQVQSVGETEAKVRSWNSLFVEYVLSFNIALTEEPLSKTLIPLSDALRGGEQKQTWAVH